MTALYLKATHIVFVVTWFAGLFYMPRLLVYLTESYDKAEPERSILVRQLTTMTSRLLFGITWPSAIITLLMGTSLLINEPAFLHYSFMHIKLTLVFFLFLYHLSLHYLFNLLKKGVVKYSSNQLRIWNEVATLFLISIVFLIVVRNNISPLWGILGLLVLAGAIMMGIRIYKNIRKK